MRLLKDTKANASFNFDVNGFAGAIEGVNRVAKIRSLDAHVPIIGVFERTEYNRFKEALAAGCNEVMTKPYSLVRLNSIFSRLL